MNEAETTGQRKARHLELCSNPDQYSIEGDGPGFEKYAFSHKAMPEASFDELDTSTCFLGRTIPVPLFISCMTGGSRRGHEVNRELSIAAESLGIPIGTGSIRILATHPELAEQFALKKWAPSVSLLANIGAVQIRDMDDGIVHGLVGMTGADALVIHLNPGQELFQPDGDRDFRGVREALARFIERAPYPVIVKETGFGVSPEETAFLLEAGAAYVDLAGSGGANWISVESYRGGDALAANEFGQWGYKLAELLPLVPTGSGRILASGGLRTGTDCAMALALGATACGMATPLARCAYAGDSDTVVEYLQRVVFVLKTIMTLTGCRTIADLRRKGVLVPRP